MISNLFEKNIMRVLALFLISPGSRYLRKEIKEKTEMNNVPLDKTLIKLSNLKMIRKGKNLFELNPEFINGEIYKKTRKEFLYFNLPLRIYFILLEICSNLLEIKGIKEVYLFGSYAKLIYSDKSDIDLAVIFNNKTKKNREIEKRIEKMAGKIGRKNRQEIEIHFFIEKDMKEKDPLIKDILRNGKKLFGEQ
jgi:predicted nucleotidyltransferase